MEILTFRTVKTSDQLKENLVRRWLNSTLPLADFARGKQIDPEVFARWVARYRKAASAPASFAKKRREDPVVLLKLDRKSLLSSGENRAEDEI